MRGVCRLHSSRLQWAFRQCYVGAHAGAHAATGDHEPMQIRLVPAALSGFNVGVQVRIIFYEGKI